MVLITVATYAIGTLAVAYAESDIQDADLAIDVISNHRDQSYITQSDVDNFKKDGMVVIKNVLTESELQSARACVENITNEGRMQNTSANSITIRQDKVCFVRESDGTNEAGSKEAQNYSRLGEGLLNCMAILRGATSRLESLGYDRSNHHRVPKQCQLAHYTGNGKTGYLPHRDAASDTNFYQIGLLAW